MTIVVQFYSAIRPDVSPNPEGIFAEFINTTTYFSNPDGI